MDTIYKNCQSCGMPKNKDSKGGGTEADGTKSTMYCSHCYRDGSFTQPKITADEMVVFVNGKLSEMKIPVFMAWFFTRGIRKLERWNR